MTDLQHCLSTPPTLIPGSPGAGHDLSLGPIPIVTGVLKVVKARHRPWAWAQGPCARGSRRLRIALLEKRGMIG